MCAPSIPVVGTINLRVRIIVGFRMPDSIAEPAKIPLK